MTEERFIDMFNRIHNPEYYYGKKKTKKKTVSRIQSTGLSGLILLPIQVGLLIQSLIR